MSKPHTVYTDADINELSAMLQRLRAANGNSPNVRPPQPADPVEADRELLYWLRAQSADA